MGSRRFRVLLAESAPGETAESLRALYPELDSHLELSVVSTIPTLLATLELAQPECILLDLSLGKPYPLDVVRRIHRAAPGIPLIVFADAADKSYASRSIPEGATDYLLKEFMDTGTIERALRTALERNTLGGLADLLRDPVTGLYNRDGFATLGARTMEMARRSGGTLVLLCAVLEDNSSLQEESGSRCSEQAVRETADLISHCFRRSDFIARLGEVQFAALAVDAAEPSARVLRQRVESRLAIFNQNRKPSGPLALRLGVGYWGANDTRSFAEFLESVEADLRLPEMARAPGASSQESSVGRH